MKQLILLLLASSLFACSFSEENFAKIKIGDESSKVEELVGSAWDTRNLESEGDEIWYYGEDYAVVISGSKVVGIIKEGEETEMLEGLILNEINENLPIR